MSVLLETRQLQVGIAEQVFCKALNIVLEAGQCCAVLGVNGAGKTTLLHTLAGLRGAQGGEILLNQQTLSHYSRRELAKTLGVLLQETHDPFPSTVLETTLIGRHPYTKSWQWENTDDYKIAMESLAQVGLDSLVKRQINTLSGGERQRLAVATLLTQSPQVFLLDEPTNHLDLQHQHQILKLFREYADEHQRAVVMILHDINLAATYCDQALLLFTERESEYGPSDELLTERNLSDLYRYPIRKITGGGHPPVFIAN